MVDMSSLMPREQPRLKPCCRNKKAPWLEGTLGTTYRNEYVAKEVPIERAVRKVEPVANAPRFDGTTTMGTDFQAYQVKRELPIRPPSTNLAAEGPFAGDSQYRSEFGPKAVPYHRAHAPNAYEPNKAPFDGTTSNKTDYQQREVAAPVRAVAHSSNLPATAGPFEGASLYKDTYGRQPYARRDLLVPPSGGQVVPRGPFDSATIYNSAYQAKEISRPVQVRPVDSRPFSATSWLELPSTEQRSQFVGKDVPVVRPSSAPRGQPLFKGAFDGTTTHNADFLPYQSAPARPVLQPSALQPSKQRFAGDSQYRSEFGPKAVPYERARAPNAYEPNKAPFDGSTTHKAAFQAVEVPRTQRVAPHASSILQGSAPFEGASLYKDSFGKQPYARRGLLVPQGNAVQSGPFDGSTTYHQDFTAKEIPARHWPRRDDECESCVDGIPGVTCREEY
ncbi:hypothetical protein V8C86DRAFT_3140445 [Haematococcus lacustris]